MHTRAHTHTLCTLEGAESMEEPLPTRESGCIWKTFLGCGPEHSAGREVRLKTGFIDVLCPLCSPPGRRAPFSYLQDHRCVAALEWALPLRAKARALHWAAPAPFSSPAAHGLRAGGEGLLQVPRASAVPGLCIPGKPGPSPVGRGALSSHLPLSCSSVSAHSHRVPPCGSGRPGRRG